MAVAVQPMAPSMWDPLQPQQHHHHMSQSQWPPARVYGYPGHQVIQSPYETQQLATPTIISGAPAVQPATGPRMRPVRSSQTSFSGPWTKEMDDILLEYHPRLRWNEIAERFFNNEKSHNACRKRFSRLLVERKQPSSWNPDRVDRVINAYGNESMREQIWSPLADLLGESWQDIEKLCFEKGLKGMTTRPQSAHLRRRSQARSHVSRRSVSSTTYSHHDAVDEDLEDDSGIGQELQETARQHMIPQQSEYHPPGYQPQYYDPYNEYSTDHR